MKNKLLISLTMAFSFSSFGNVTPVFVTEAGNIRTETISFVQMVQESVYVEIGEKICSVKCKYWMMSKIPITKERIGFPEYIMLSDTFEDDQFTCRVDGKKVKCTVISDTVLELASYVYRWHQWEMSFKPKDTTIIEINYTGHFNWDNSFRYQLGTGRNWTGSINKGVIIFDLLKNHVKSNFKPFAPKGIDIIYNENKYKFLFSNFKPQNDSDYVSIRYLDPLGHK